MMRIEHGWYYRSIGEVPESELKDILEWQEYMRLADEIFGKDG